MVAAKIAAGTITATQIASQTITATQIAANTIAASNIVAGTLTSASGVFGAISATDISTGTLNANRINLNGTTLEVSSDGLQIKASGVTNNELGTRAVGSFAVNGASGTSGFGDGRSGDNFSDLSTVSFTTLEAGDYLICGNCMVGGTFNTLTQLESRIIVDSTVVAEYSSPVGGSAIQPVVLAGKITLAAATTFTIKLQGQVTADNTTPNIGGFSTRVSAIKLNKQ